MVLPVVLGVAWRGRVLPGRLLGCSLLCSGVFFLTTNFGVWFFGTLYAHDLSGLLRCYAAALPFFKYTLAGDLFYSVGIFGSFVMLNALRRYATPKPQIATLEVEA
jgi:hypothetical protein